MKKTLIICAVVTVLTAALAAAFLGQTIILSYEEIINRLSIDDSGDAICIMCNFHVSDINYLANSDGTVFIRWCEDHNGRCYRQSIQVIATKWDIMFSNQESVLHRRELTGYGALSGESAIIDDDGTVSSVNRYDTEVYYRDADGDEQLLWSFER